MLTGALLLLACVLAPRSGAGALLAITGVAGALLATRPAPRVVGWALGLGLLFYLPLVALLALPQLLATGSAALPTLAWIVARGAAALLVSLATLSTLRPAELHPAIAGLPLPATARLILLQVVQQSGLMLEETARIRAVIAVRAGAPRGRSGWALLRSLPAAWLARLAARADRVADAMEVRGYVEGGLLGARGTRGSAADGIALASAGALLLLAAALHLR
jgi:energy-coupling factor transporter transmembrane protein EcfT